MNAQDEHFESVPESRSAVSTWLLSSLVGPFWLNLPQRWRAFFQG
jgi:hypothetical protein